MRYQKHRQYSRYDPPVTPSMLPIHVAKHARTREHNKQQKRRDQKPAVEMNRVVAGRATYVARLLEDTSVVVGNVQHHQWVNTNINTGISHLHKTMRGQKDQSMRHTKNDSANASK